MKDIFVHNINRFKTANRHPDGRRSKRGVDGRKLMDIAEEIRTHSDSCIPLSKQIIQMAEDFDLDGIQKLADTLETC